MNDTTTTRFTIERYYSLQINRAAFDLRAFPKYLIKEIQSDVVKYLAVNHDQPTNEE